MFVQERCDGDASAGVRREVNPGEFHSLPKTEDLTAFGLASSNEDLNMAQTCSLRCARLVRSNPQTPFHAHEETRR